MERNPQVRAQEPRGDRLQHDGAPLHRVSEFTGEAQQERELLIKVLIYNIGRLNYLKCAGR
ncbi:MAG: hypothetical protein ACTSVT_09410 [Candidatus Thorarchaeota archaeon]